jgi:hypothetical protein
VISTSRSISDVAAEKRPFDRIGSAAEEIGRRREPSFQVHPVAGHSDPPSLGCVGLARLGMSKLLFEIAHKGPKPLPRQAIVGGVRQPTGLLQAPVQLLFVGTATHFDRSIVAQIKTTSSGVRSARTFLIFVNQNGDFPVEIPDLDVASVDKLLGDFDGIFERARLVGSGDDGREDCRNFIATGWNLHAEMTTACHDRRPLHSDDRQAIEASSGRAELRPCHGLCST